MPGATVVLTCQAPAYLADDIILSLTVVAVYTSDQLLTTGSN